MLLFSTEGRYLGSRDSCDWHIYLYVCLTASVGRGPCGVVYRVVVGRVQYSINRGIQDVR